MNYWLLTSEFPPAYGGGISTYCIETAKMLTAKGNKVTVITQDFGVNGLRIEDKGPHRLVNFNPGKYYTSSFLGYEANLSYAFAQAVKELIEKEGLPDVIESQEYMGIAYYLLQHKWLGYSPFKDLKVVITLHAPSFLYLDYNKVPNYQLPYFWIGEMERFCIRAADLLISPSQYLVNEIEHRVKTDDLIIHILKNPYKAEQQKITDVFTRNKIVFFGKLIPQKGCLELLKYFKQLWQQGFEHSLTMIGGGDHMYHPEGIDMIDFIKQSYSTEIRQGKLILLGSIPPSELNRHISDAHVIIIPSIVDNLPYTVPEVMALGKVVLASKQGGQSEIIEDGVDGFLFDHKQPESFNLKLKEVLSLNDAAISKVSANAINKITAQFDYDKVYEQKIKLLEQLDSAGTRQNFPYIRPQKTVKQLSNPTENNGLLSVIVPYYNMGQYVEETIKSIVNSTYKQAEIIIVNDGSTDFTSTAVLKTLSEKYPVTIINKQNQGLALARNTGAVAAKGEFLAFLDPDDTVEPTYYEKAIGVLKNCNNVCFVGCWANYFGENTGYWPTFNPEPPYLLVHNMINSSALVYKKQAFINSGLNDAEMVFGMEDYESLIKLVENGYQGVVLPEPLWNYRVRKNSMARAFTKNKEVYLYRLIAEKHKAFYSTFGAEVANLLNANGPGYKYDNPTFFYNMPGNGIMNNTLKNMIVKIVKSNPLLRKIAIKLKNSLQ